MLHDYGCKENGSFWECNKWMIHIGLLWRVHQSRPEFIFHTRIYDPIHLPCAPSRCTQQHATFPETSSASGGVQARVHASWTFRRSRFPAWETQVSDSTPTHTASKDRRLLLFRITAERGEGHVNALGFKYTTRTRRNGCCHRNDSDAARKHPKKLGPAFV